MAYVCNNGACRPCQHIESVVKCPDCGKRLILAPGKAWVFCPDWYLCEFEMAPQKFIETYQVIPELDDK